MDTYISVDIGGTNIRVALYPQEGNSSLKQKKIRTKGKGSPEDRTVHLIADLWPENDRVVGIGVAAPGPLDAKTGVIYSAPNIPVWKNLPLRDIIQDRFNVPVSIGNDANMAALGEWKFGAGQGHADMIYMTISTGIGGGVILDNRLILGRRGLAGELGHISVVPDGPRCGCGHHGHLEALASGTGISRYVSDQIATGRPSILSSLPSASAEEISKAASEGDELAVEALQRAGFFIGKALADYLHIFNPSIVVLGGGVTHSGQLLLEPLKKALFHHVISTEYLRDLEIKIAALGDNAGLLGALTLTRLNTPLTT